MGIRAVIFDLGGVIVRTEDYSGRESLAQRLGISRLALEEIVFASESGSRSQLGELTIEQHWENVRQYFSLSISEMEVFQRDYWAGDRVDLDLVDYIRSLRPAYRTALLSNAFSDLRQVVTERWKFADAFDVMIISSEVGMTKPDPRIYHLAVERLGIEPGEAVFVDDFLHNVEGARAVGLQAIHFIDSHQVLQELHEMLNNDGVAGY
jgi:epoxide hydrolase-like predicted phosphatase